jgi:hypothetical protein
MVTVSKSLLFNTIFHLYRGKNKIPFDEMISDIPDFSAKFIVLPIFAECVN